MSLCNILSKMEYIASYSVLYINYNIMYIYMHIPVMLGLDEELPSSLTTETCKYTK